MAIERGEVERVAELARLEIPAERLERMTRELSAVLDFAAALNRLDLEGCEPTVFAPAGAPLREDRIDGRRLPTKTALATAPEGEGGFFLTPPIVENVNP
jgi:aspartyl-tRNA(Asn)/glutamyl-tRNA(Gln) amidotransferase subunit C